MSVISRMATTAQVTDDATFRVWGKWFSDSWQTLGWTKVTDAAQIDWATCIRQASLGSSGYEVRQSTDALTPIYFKIEYIAGNNTGTSNPEFYLTFGTGQDGAGTLTGAVSTRYRWGMYSSGSQGLTTFMMSGTTGRWSVAMIDSNATTPGVYGDASCCQRTCDTNGTDNSTGFMYALGYTNAGVTSVAWGSGYVDFTTGHCGEDNGPTWMFLNSVPRFTVDKPVFFPLYVRGTNSFVMLRDLVLIPTVMAAARTITSLTHYGSSRKYMAGTYSSAAAQNGYVVPITMALCVRCE